MKILITGACGFIGTCLSVELIKQGHQVFGLDNLSRPGTEYNLWELEQAGAKVYRLDVRYRNDLEKFMKTHGAFDAIFHLCGQVAVTLSYDDRNHDFDTNALGTFNLMELAYQYSPEAYCLYASTNKVYGHLEFSEPVGVEGTLDPYTPYGISKAVGELYVREYSRPEFGMATCALRQSCIYGHHQFGIEDQGWLAWFMIANWFDLPISIYGNGTQIRDVLFVDDLVRAYILFMEKRHVGVFPIGGGRGNAINLGQGLEMIADATGKQFATINREPERAGDQPYFVADNSWVKDAGLDWAPSTEVAEGLSRMAEWMKANVDPIQRVLERKQRG